MIDEFDISLLDPLEPEIETPPNPGRPSKATPEFKAWQDVKHLAMWEEPGSPNNVRADALRQALDATPEARWERYCFLTSEKHLKDLAFQAMELRQEEARIASIREGGAERARRSYHNRKSNPGRDDGKSSSPGLGR